VGMKIKLQALSKELSPLHISTSANEAANKLTLALGGKEAPVGRRKLIKPLRASGSVRRRFAARGRFLSHLAGLLLGKPLDGLLALLRVTEFYGQLPGSNIKDISHFDHRFDEFWTQSERHRSIAVVRDAAYLNWRYARYPFAGIEAFSLEMDGDLSGFAAIHTSREEGEVFVAVLELMAAVDRPEAHEQLLGEVVRRAVDAGASSITARTADAALESLLIRRGFRLRTTSYSPVTYKNNTSVDDAFFEADGNWYLSQGDGDGCFFYD
ncbi:hypothetical protein ACFL3S_04820, partial [Gemmatimonadota bacterium]